MVPRRGRPCAWQEGPAVTPLLTAGQLLGPRLSMPPFSYKLLTENGEGLLYYYRFLGDLSSLLFVVLALRPPSATFTLAQEGRVYFSRCSHLFASMACSYPPLALGDTVIFHISGTTLSGSYGLTPQVVEQL